MVKAVGTAAVVISTGYTVVSVGRVHAVAAEQAVVGVVASVSLVAVPVVWNAAVPRGAAGVVDVNVVAEAVTCQPAPDPVASSTRYVSSTPPTAVSGSAWSM